MEWMVHMRLTNTHAHTCTHTYTHTQVKEQSFENMASDTKVYEPARFMTVHQCIDLMLQVRLHTYAYAYIYIYMCVCE
jgi:hypothetical protein